MPDASGTLETIALELARVLRPLEELLGEGIGIFTRLGEELPREIVGDANIASKLTAAATKAGALDPLITALATAITNNDSIAIVQKGVPLLQNIADLIGLLKQLGDALHQAANALSAADKARLQTLAAEMAVRTIEYMAVGYLDARMPSLTSSLDLLGIIDREFKPDESLEITNAPSDVIPRRFRIDQLSKFVVHPDQYLQDRFKFGRPDFDGSEFLTKTLALLENLGVPGAIFETPGQPPALEAFLFGLQADTSLSPPGLKAEMALPGNTTFDRAVDFSDLWKGTVHVEANYAAGVGVTWQPPFTIKAIPPTGNIDLKALVGLKAQNPDNSPITLFAVAGGTRLQAKSIGGSVGIDAHLSASGGEINPEVQLQVEDGKFIVDFSEGDGLIQKLLAGVKLEANFPLTATWNPKDGLRVTGDAGLEVFIPLHQNLAIVDLNGLYFSLGIGNDSALHIGLAAQITAHLGPIVATLDRIGADAAISFPPNGSGRLGMADFNLDFVPPKGVGLALDAGVIKGGGFLSVDTAKGEYVGALELTFQDVIALKAIGIINTKMPDGTPGFALLILVTAEFVPIQLGFGFTLVGVGGLLGLNRRLDTEALRVGVRTGALNSVLFPQDIIANITRIISDIKDIFPLAVEHFVLGPMGKLGWGTPTLLSIEIGVIIDLPTPAIVIAGVLQASLPAEDLPILHLQVNFAGGIDFQKGLIWFDASLYDSHLLIYTLTGDMALRIGWGDQAIFILTVGGFHPSFSEIPPDLQNLRRLSISLLSGDNPRLTCATYFAITSNTVQNGSRVELYAEGCGLNIYGFLGYDLLVQFNPFHFVADLDAGLALRDGTDELMGIHVHGELSGPNPFRARGDASIDLFLFSISISFDVTWGDDAAPQIEAEVDVLPVVQAALNDDRNWLATLPANTHQNVTVKKLELPPEQIVMNPFAVLAVSQKIVPLGFDINKFGNQKPKGTTRFDLTTNDGGTEEVREEFAIANFQHLSDSEKLARKSFEQMRSGLRFSTGDSSQTGANVDKDVTYELSYVHRKRGISIRAGLVRLFGTVFSMFAGAGAVTKNKFAVSGRIGGTPIAKVDVEEPEFHVVNGADLTLYAAGLSAKSEAEAWQLHDDLVATDPSLSGRLQVMSSYELSEAA
jgi:hypothetical protein